MARLTPIRISKNDRKEHARMVRNARAKINRTVKNYGVDLSGEIDLPSIDDFTTRDELNQWKEEQKRFTNRANWKYQYEKNQYGVVKSKKELSVATRRTRSAQRIADEQLKEIMNKPVEQGGQVYGTVADRMLHMPEPDATGIHRPKDFDFSQVRNERRFKDIMDSMDKRRHPDYYDKRKEQMKANFMTALEGSFNNEADELIERLGSIPADDFYDMWLRIEEFDFKMYDSEGQSVDANEGSIMKMIGYIDKYEAGKVSKDLKPF